MSAYNFDLLKQHVGHKIKVVMYGEENVSCECETCNEVIIDFNKFEESN